MFSQLRGQFPPFVARGRLLKLRQRAFGKQGDGQRIEGISGGASGAGPSYRTAPRSISNHCSDLRQKRKNAGSNQGTLSRTAGSQNQYEWPFRARLFLQSIEHFSDGFRSAAKNRGMLEIEEQHAPKRV